jgi:hypothetical protein
MALDAKKMPSMQIDFLVSIQEAKAKGTMGQYNKSSTFMAGGHQWRLCCYPIGMNDHQWMDVPDGIGVILVPVNKSQMAHVSLLQ